MSTAPSEDMIIGGRYRVVRELAVGGMGAVYEAENLRTRRRVAIKTIRPEVASRVSVIHRFEVEARAAGQLQHPNIVEVLDLGDDADQQMLFSVQEFLVGGDLGRCLEAVGTLSPEATLATLLPVLDALEFAHRQGVVHRDIKPDNIFLHETPLGVVPKLIDFGVAKLADEAGQRRSANGSLVGSPIYMSPEQVRAQGDIDGRTDVWSMGVVFYETLTGGTPFSGPSPYAVLTQIAMGEPVRLATLGPQLPADLVAVIERAVTQDRELRWQTMGEFAEALRATETWCALDPAHAGELIPSVRGMAPEKAAASTVRTVQSPLPVEAVRTPSSGGRPALWSGEVSSHVTHNTPGHGRALSVLVAVLCVVFGVGIAVTRTGRPQSDAPPPVRVLRRAPPMPEAEAPAPAPLAEPAPPVVQETPAVVTIVADAGAPPLTAHAPTVRRQPARRRVVRRPAPPSPTVTTVTHGFNGSPIVD